MGEIDFARTMSRYPDEEVIRIAFAGNDDGYVPAAVAAAKAEVAARQLSKASIEDALGDQARQRDTAVPVADIPMTIQGRIFYAIFAFFLFIPAMIVAIVIEANGYKRKAKEAWISIAVGVSAIALIVIPLIFYSG